MINIFGTTNIDKLVKEKKTDRIIKLLYNNDINLQMNALWGIEELLVVEAIPNLWHMVEHYKIFTDNVREKAIEVLIYLAFNPDASAKIKANNDLQFLLRTRALPELWSLTGSSYFDNQSRLRTLKAIFYLVYRLKDRELSKETVHRIFEITGSPYYKIESAKDTFDTDTFDLLAPYLEYFKEDLIVKLGNMINSKDEKKHKACLNFIARVQYPIFTPIFLRAFQSEKWWTRRIAILSIESINYGQSEQVLISHLANLIPNIYDSNNQLEIEDCIKSLSALNSTIAVTTLIPLLNPKWDSPDNSIRKATIIALSAIGGKQAEDAILECKFHYYFEWIDAVKKIGDNRAVEELKKGLEYPNEGIKQRSAEALKLIEGNISVSLEFIAEKFNKECRKIVGDIEYGNKNFWQFGVGPSGKTPIPSQNEVIEKAKRNIQLIYQLNYEELRKMVDIASYLRE